MSVPSHTHHVNQSGNCHWIDSDDDDDDDDVMVSEHHDVMVSEHDESRPGEKTFQTLSTTTPSLLFLPHSHHQQQEQGNVDQSSKDPHVPGATDTNHPHSPTQRRWDSGFMSHHNDTTLQKHDSLHSQMISKRDWINDPKEGTPNRLVPSLLAPTRIAPASSTSSSSWWPLIHSLKHPSYTPVNHFTSITNLSSLYDRMVRERDEAIQQAAQSVSDCQRLRDDLAKAEAFLLAAQQHRDALRRDLDQAEEKLITVRQSSTLSQSITHHVMEISKKCEAQLRAAVNSNKTLLGHEGEVTSVYALEKDGLILSGSVDGSLRVWDSVYGTCLDDQDGHGVWITCVCGSSRNSLFSGGTDGVIVQWSLLDQDPSAITLHEGRRFVGHTAGISDIESDASILVSGSRDSYLASWDIKTGKQLSRFQSSISSSYASIDYFEDQLGFSSSGDCGFEGFDSSISKNPFKAYDSGLPFSSSIDSKNALLNSTSRRHRTEYGAHRAPIPNSIHFYQHALLAGFSDGFLCCFDLRSGKMERVLGHHSGGITACTFDVSTCQVVSGGDDRVIKTWDLRGNGVTQEFTRALPITDLCFESTRIYLADSSHQISRIDQRTGVSTVLSSLSEGHTDGILCLSARKDMLVSGGMDGRVCVWANVH